MTVDGTGNRQHVTRQREMNRHPNVAEVSAGYRKRLRPEFPRLLQIRQTSAVENGKITQISTFMNNSPCLCCPLLRPDVLVASHCKGPFNRTQILPPRAPVEIRVSFRMGLTFNISSSARSESQSIVQSPLAFSPRTIPILAFCLTNLCKNALWRVSRIVKRCQPRIIGIFP